MASSSSSSSSLEYAAAEARKALAQYALHCLEEQRTRSGSSSSPSRNKQKPQLVSSAFAIDEEEQDVTKIAVAILLSHTRMVLTGSDEPRMFMDFSSKPESIAKTLAKPASMAVDKQAPSSTVKKKPQGPVQAPKGCRAPGCGRPFASTSSSYCDEHVGATALCSIIGCPRVAEGEEGPQRFCRLHMLEALEKSKQAQTEASGVSNPMPVQNPVARTNPTAAPADFELPKGVIKTCQFDTCTKKARGASWFCIQHGGGKRCQFRNCARSSRGATSFCVTHGGGKRCAAPLCTRSAVGPTQFCISHGGGKRCQYTDCPHSAEGGTSFCIRHGGGRRCKTPECNKSAVGTTDYCVACGGGRRCGEPGCNKSAVGATLFCKAHGGGRRCTHPDGCNKSAQGATFLCIIHGGGGGKRCSAAGCLAPALTNGLCKEHRGKPQTPTANGKTQPKPDEAKRASSAQGAEAKLTKKSRKAVTSDITME